jgi:hypothetical protein
MAFPRETRLVCLPCVLLVQDLFIGGMAEIAAHVQNSGLGETRIQEQAGRTSVAAIDVRAGFLLSHRHLPLQGVMSALLMQGEPQVTRRDLAPTPSI